MRAPRRRHAPRRTFASAITPAKLAEAAERVRYEGSPEHKVAYSWLGPRKLRSDATPCPPTLKDPGVLTEWLREAVRDGQVSEHWEGEFPRYVWARREEAVFEARLINQGAGNYKGYPLASHEIPEELP